MLKNTLAVAFSDPCVLLRCCTCAAQANLLCVSVTGEQGNPAGMEGECQSRIGCSFPSACLAVSLWEGVSSPPQCPWGCVPVSQLLLAISAAAMPLHCEDAVQGHSWFHG